MQLLRVKKMNQIEITAFSEQKEKENILPSFAIWE